MLVHVHYLLCYLELYSIFITYVYIAYVGKHPDVPTFPFDAIKQKFKFISLQMSPEVIGSLAILREECGTVTNMGLFHIGTGKPLKLEEFDQSQSQMSIQVSPLLL